jgi:hypothetical protein
MHAVKQPAADHASRAVHDKHRVALREAPKQQRSDSVFFALSEDKARGITILKIIHDEIRAAF